MLYVTCEVQTFTGNVYGTQDLGTRVSGDAKGIVCQEMRLQFLLKSVCCQAEQFSALAEAKRTRLGLSWVTGPTVLISTPASSQKSILFLVLIKYLE